MTEVKIVNPLDIPDWDSRIGSLPGVSFFDTAAWARVLSETYGYQPVYFSVFDNDRMTGFLPLMEVRSIFTGNRGISLPFTDNCGPVGCDEPQFRAIAEKVVDYGIGRHWRFFEVRGGRDFLPNAAVSKEFLVHILDLRSDEDEIQSHLRDSTRRNIKKAISQGVTAEISSDFRSLEDFCALNCLTRREHGLPPQPFRFFDSVYRNIISQGHGFVSLARFQGKPIAADMYFQFGNESIYKYGASDRNFQHLRASNLVMWEGIRHLKNSGIHALDLGRTELFHHGLRQFKLGWGAREATLSYVQYDFKQKAFVAHEKKQTDPSYTTVLKHTPIPLLKMAGAVVYKHMA